LLIPLILHALAPPWLSDVLDLDESQAGDEGGLGSNQLRGRRA
jgi:hypothetical protein